MSFLENMFKDFAETHSRFEHTHKVFNDQLAALFSRESSAEKPVRLQSNTTISDEAVAEPSARRFEQIEKQIAAGASEVTQLKKEHDKRLVVLEKRSSADGHDTHRRHSILQKDSAVDMTLRQRVEHL